MMEEKQTETFEVSPEIFLKYAQVFDNYRQEWLSLTEWEKNKFVKDVEEDLCKTVSSIRTYNKWTINLCWILLFQLVILYQLPPYLWIFMSGMALCSCSIGHLIIGSLLRKARDGYIAAFLYLNLLYKKNT